MYDYLIVGAGFAGSVFAERAANAGRKVLIVERRSYLGGNAHDLRDAAGILVHAHGPHIFHTNSDRVFAYLSRFTRWRRYEHRVRASVNGRLLPFPINRTTIALLAGLSVDSADVAAYLAAQVEPQANPRTAEEFLLGRIGRQLYETFYQHYTRKMWGLDPTELDASVVARIPVRTDADDRYFVDRHQGVPADGYTRMFERMLDHPNISLLKRTEFCETKGRVRYRELIFTGPIDEFFGYCFGPLPYRSLRFRHETLDLPRFQPVAVVNYPEARPAHTRITEFKHLTGQEHPRTSIVYEYPCAEGPPYYPILTAQSLALHRRYDDLASQIPGVHFLGRLGRYRYYNMDQVVGQALALAGQLLPGTHRCSSSG